VRRSDREVSEIRELGSIIEKCDVCRLGMAVNNLPYIVPMNFGFEIDEEGCLWLYFHGAKEGRKIDVLQTNPNVCFEMDCGHELITGSDGCSYSFAYESIIGNGRAEFVENSADKIYALSKIMEKAAGVKGIPLNENMVKNVAVIKIKSTDFTGKRRAK
jgi:uncharacterized protein